MDNNNLERLQVFYFDILGQMPKICKEADLKTEDKNTIKLVDNPMIYRSIILLSVISKQVERNTYSKTYRILNQKTISDLLADLILDIMTNFLKSFPI